MDDQLSKGIIYHPYPSGSSPFISHVVTWSPSIFRPCSFCMISRSKCAFHFLLVNIMAGNLNNVGSCFKEGIISCLHGPWGSLVSHHHGSLRSSAVATRASRRERIRAAVWQSTLQYHETLFPVLSDNVHLLFSSLANSQNHERCELYSLGTVYPTVESTAPRIYASIRRRRTMIIQFSLPTASPDYTQTNLRGKVTCHETINYPLAWPESETGPPTQKDLVDILHARLLSLFVDVLCIFARDCGGLDGVAERLTSWTAIGSASSGPSSTRPRLLVVTNIPGHAFDSEVLRFRLRVLADPKFAGAFSSLNVVNILGLTRRPSRDLFSGLKEVLHSEIRTARVERANAHMLFSMTHITAFFDMALRNFATRRWIRLTSLGARERGTLSPPTFSIT